MTILHRSLKTFAAKPMSQEEIDSLVFTTVNQLGHTYEDWDRAQSHYNSDFFKGESPEFKLAMCKALAAHFKNKPPSSFWLKVVKNT